MKEKKEEEKREEVVAAVAAVAPTLRNAALRKVKLAGKRENQLCHS